METKDFETTVTENEEICVDATKATEFTLGYIEEVKNSEDNDKTSMESIEEKINQLEESDAQSLASEEDISNTLKGNITKNYGNVDETEALKLFSLIVKYHQDPNSFKDQDIVDLLPSFIKMEINKNLMQNNIAPSRSMIASIAKELLEELYDQSEMEANFNSLDKELQELLNMPEITDMYFEESAKNIQENIPKTYEKLMEDGEEEKAKLLMEVKNAFDDSVSLEKVFNAYLDISRIKRSVRRFNKPVKSLYASFDYIHKSNKLKIPSLEDAHKGISHVYTTDKWKKDGLKESDVDKFIVLLYYAYGVLDTHDFASEANVFYTMKNIAMLKFVGVGKTKFSQNFINNIKKLILCIKTEEAKYNETNPKNNKAKSRKSRSKN